MTSPPSCPRPDLDPGTAMTPGELAHHRNALNPEEPNMRLIAFALAAFVVSGPAAAENWKEYSYPAYSFTVAFPADPQTETTTYRLPDGRPVEAHVYAVSQNDSVLKVMVAELGNTGL